MRRASDERTEPVDPLIGHDPGSMWGDGLETDVHFACGTAKVNRLAVEVVEEASPLLELVAIPHPLFVLGPNGVVENANAQAAALLGYTRDELVGECVTFLATDIALPLHRVRSFTGCIRRHDGTKVDVDVLLSPHGDDSTIALVCPRARPVHDNSEVLQIVHDLKNPLATIALELGLLETKLHQGELRSAVARVIQNVAYLDRMVQDLVDAGSLHVEQFELHPRRIELRALIERMIERSTPTRDRARVHFDAPCPISIVVDEHRIERVIANLLGNALKYSPSSTPIVIRLESRPGVARVSVTDTGLGIRPEDAARIFEPYWRAATARSHEGSGLGLYISKRIIEAHRGRIGVDSRYQGGSCFFFELPFG